MKINDKNTENGNARTDMAVSAIFGKIKVNIDFSFVGVKNLCLMVTSSLPNEGKTTISANTAAAMAAAGKKTLLLDADMRNASLHLLFNYVNANGLSNIISQNGDWREFLIKTNIPNLFIITAGRKPLNTTKYVSSDRFKEFLEEIHKEFDYIVIDTPPVLVLPDSQIISPLVDGVILVVNSGITTAEQVKIAGESLKRANANVIGSVLNNVKVKGGAYGYGYGYGYGDGTQKNARRAAATQRPKALKLSKPASPGRPEEMKK